MLSQELIRKLNNDDYFKEFMNYCLEEIARLDSVSELSGVTDISNTDLGELVKARSMAIELLQNILDPIFLFKDKKEPTIEEIKAKKNSYGY